MFFPNVRRLNPFFLFCGIFGMVLSWLYKLFFYTNTSELLLTSFIGFFFGGLFLFVMINLLGIRYKFFGDILPKW